MLLLVVIGNLGKRFGDLKQRSSAPRTYHTGPRRAMTTTAPKNMRMAPNLQVYRPGLGCKGVTAVGKPLKKQGIIASATPNPRKRRKLHNPRGVYRGVYLAKRNRQNDAALDRWRRSPRSRELSSGYLARQRIGGHAKSASRAEQPRPPDALNAARAESAQRTSEVLELTRQNSKLESDLANEKANGERLTQQFKTSSLPKF